ncbi:MAG: DUF481 domain-containing protein, partial [Lysobacteraceae bacterium]
MSPTRLCLTLLAFSCASHALPASAEQTGRNRMKVEPNQQVEKAAKTTKVLKTATVDGAEAPAEPSPWSGGGELGYASTRGNSISESLNTRFHLHYAEGDWIHGLEVFGLRSSAEYRVEDEDGAIHREHKDTANRYTVGASSALKLGEHRQFTTALRYEHDDFATYRWQQTASVGYGARIMDGGRTQLDLQVGPGLRRAQNVEEGR